MAGMERAGRKSKHMDPRALKQASHCAPGRNPASIDYSPLSCGVESREKMIQVLHQDAMSLSPKAHSRSFPSLGIPESRPVVSLNSAPWVN